jgi:hypothetical protein
MIFRLHMRLLEFKIIQTRVFDCVSQTRCSKFLLILWVRFQIWLNNMNIIFSLSFFYYLNKLQFKSDSMKRMLEMQLIR